jgi:hypothetical protein
LGIKFPENKKSVGLAPDLKKKLFKRGKLAKEENMIKIETNIILQPFSKKGEKWIMKTGLLKKSATSCLMVLLISISSVALNCFVPCQEHVDGK